MNTWKKYIYKQENQEDMIFEFSNLAVNAENEIMVSCGQTKVLVTIANGGPSDKNYLPLKVDYVEKFYATGKILGGKYNKREGKPSTEATLTARLIDRSIRPYFPKTMRNDLHIVITVLSLGEYDPDILALNGASCALMTSSLDWNGPVFAGRVISQTDESLDEKKYTVNPTYTEREKSTSDSLISFKEEKGEMRVCMIENDSDQISEEDFLQILQKGQKESEKLKDFFAELFKYDGVTKEDYVLEERFGVKEMSKKEQSKKEQEKILEEDWSVYYDHRVREDLSLISNRKEKNSIQKDLLDLQKNKEDEYAQEIDFHLIRSFVDAKFKRIMRSEILKNKRRIDGRELDQVRDLTIQAGGFSDIHHGTGIFYRGYTRVMSVLTMGSLDNALVIEGMEINTEKNFIHHYNFPPFSVGESGRLGSASRREIGHGALAEKGLKRVIPSSEEFPYTMRIVSEAFSSNGSTSMASATAGSLALMDAGVPIEPIAGIAVGLVYEEDFLEEGKDSYEFITDILGTEDHFGDMDFKVIGTKKGITAIQLDIKNVALSLDMCEEILKRAKVAREYILDEVFEVIEKPRELTDKIDRVEKMKIPQAMIGKVIGKGGVTIKEITKKSGAKVNIKRDGEVFITGNKENIEKARKSIERITNNV